LLVGLVYCDVRSPATRGDSFVYLLSETYQHLTMPRNNSISPVGSPFYGYIDLVFALPACTLQYVYYKMYIYVYKDEEFGFITKFIERVE
jgi:hypothetical protein